MPRGESKILLDAEILVKLAYLTISEENDLKNLETLRLTYGHGETIVPMQEGFEEASVELTPLEELRRFCDEALRESMSLIGEEADK